MNYCGLNCFDTANGKGLRVSLFVSGCSLHCKGCFNPESWKFDAGQPFTDETLNKILQAMDNDYVSGFSLLGGDPFEPEHEKTLTSVLSEIKKRHPKKSIWCWTGRRFEKIKNSPLMKYIDVLIDGPFIEKLKVKEQGKWFGSANQRVLKIHNGYADELIS